MITIELIILVFCLVGSAFFAGIETGIIAINRLRLHHLVRRNVPGAAIIQNFVSKPDLLLGTTLVGTNLLHVIAAVIAASLGARWGGATGTGLAGLAITLIILVFCEYLPKAWFQSAPAARVLPLARLLQWASWTLLPLGRLVTGLVDLLIPARAREGEGAHPFVSREELMHLAGEGARAGLLTADEQRMIRGVFQLTAKTCGAIMTPRDKMVVIKSDCAVPELLELARKREVNRLPVFDTARQSFIGVVHVFDILSDEHPEGKTVAQYMRPPQLVAAYMPVDHLLPRMRVTRQPMVLVTDERFEVVGLLTLEDVLEEVVGEL